MRATGSRLTLPTPSRFNFVQSITTYGYYGLAPNHWDSDKETLHRPLRTVGGKLLQTTSRFDKKGKRVVVQSDRRLAKSESAEVKRAIARMLRLDEDLTGWQKLHPQAKKQGFGRLFRSPDLFEDVIKTITGCNVTWSNTKSMNRLLCEHYGDGGFPTPAKLARLKPDTLKKKCKVGYRADSIIRLAKAVETGTLDLHALDDPTRPTDELFNAFKAIHGVGDYAAGNLLQCVGKYDRVAIDSETYRHFREITGKPTPQDPAGLRRLHKKIEAHYDQYAPYQFLAYWFELWNGYVTRSAAS